MAPIVEIKNLVKRYAPTPTHKEGNLAVNAINLTIEHGEIFSLLGPNGAGKSTTINMMSGLISPTDGDVIIDGHSIIREPMVVKQVIGVVPQDIALYQNMSARQNLEFFGRMYGLNGAELAKRADEVMDFIGLKDRQHDKVQSYSGGMKRRVNIGVGLLHRPKLVFMDEPTVGVDPQSRRKILDAVKMLNQQGLTVLYTTHYMEEAEELSNRVGIIDHGELIAVGKEGELIRHIGAKDTILIKMNGAAAHAQEIVLGLPEVSLATVEDHGILKLLCDRGRQALPTVIRALDEAKLLPGSIEVREPNLETVFLQMTGRALRD
ncbi:MAG TPA: ABC transporter ATP-binding protein [Aggregatilineales bacterium]|nr:ABC transporter ATP-binding protein [Aggregatilineales bacterium]